MQPIREYDVVRVRQLLKSERFFSGTGGVRRPPQVGDLGTVVFVYGDPPEPAGFAVECVDSEGMTLWLADFVPEELESAPTH